MGAYVEEMELQIFALRADLQQVLVSMRNADLLLVNG